MDIRDILVDGIEQLSDWLDDNVDGLTLEQVNWCPDGKTVSFEETLRDVIERDRADTERAVAPLRRADDAILVDSSGRPVDDVIEEMAQVVEERARR